MYVGVFLALKHFTAPFFFSERAAVSPSFWCLPVFYRASLFLASPLLLFFLALDLV